MERNKESRGIQEEKRFRKTSKPIRSNKKEKELNKKS